jgi:general secretion pathway protein F/type IV pilus assembly protein PilC
MPEYRYEALATTGTKSQGTLTANTEQEAMSMLDSRGLYPVRIELTKQPGQAFFFRRKVKARAMAQFYGQLADLLHAGVPLLRSLDILERQASAPALGQILREVRAKVADGTSLGDAMNGHPRAFNELAVSMVRAGQEGGFLEDVLKRVAVFTDSQEDLKAKVIGALAYPIFLAIMGSAILFVLVIFFVPQFEPVFEQLRARNQLPYLTMGLISFSHFLIAWWPLILVALAAAAFGFTRWRKTPSGRVLLDTIKLRVPGAGKIYLSLALARFTRIQGTLLQNGIPLLQGLRIAKDSTGNRVLTRAIEQAAENVTEGNSLAAPLQSCPYIPRDVVEMVAVGEESNSLEKVLLDIAEALERRTARQLELFVRLLEPVMLLVMAGFTLIIVAGLLLPVFRMSEVVN